MATVLAVVFCFFCASFADLPLVFQRYELAGVFLYAVNVGAPVGAAISAVTYGERSDGIYREKCQQ